MSQSIQTYHPKPKFVGIQNGIIIRPFETFQYFRAVRIGQTVDITRGHFIGKTFTVIGKNYADEGNYLVVDAESEAFTTKASPFKSTLCTRCKRDAEVGCSCLPEQQS